jgi:WD40 repeat protein
MALASALLPGDPSRLGDFWLAGRLGAGGQGVVYEAYDADGDRVAVKVLHPAAASDPGLRSRFGREATAAQRVASFCTARVLAVDLDGPKPYIVSEYVQGPSLRQAVAGGRRFLGDDLHRLATAVATALTAIHDAGVVHRDLKPDNVLLGPDGPRVIDFGVARTLEMSLTVTGLVTGTPTYMAPEVFTGQRAGAPADVFSWGAIVLFAADGDDPFQAESLGAVMHRVLATDPDLSSLPRSLRPLVSASLAKDPLARPSARELLLGLITGFHGSEAELLTMGSAEACLLGREAPSDPALGTLAEDAYGFLEPAERDLVPDLFLRMVTITDTGELTTRHVSREEMLDGRPPEHEAALQRVLDVFGYVVTVRGDDITLARPALVRAWPRLRTWMDDERDGLPVHDMIRAAARHWTENGRREGDVFQGSRLETSLRWAATGRRHITLSTLEKDFLDACNAATRHGVRRRRQVTALLAGLLVVALVGGAIAVQQSRLVSAQSRMVAAQRDEAVAVKIAAESDTMRTYDPVLATLLSVAAWRLAPVAASRVALTNAWAQRERSAFDDPDTSGETVRQITRDGRRLVSVSPGSVRVFDLRSGKMIGGWNDHRIGGQRLRGIDLSPSGRLLAVAADKFVEVWDMTTGRPTAARYKLEAPENFHQVTYGLGDRWIAVHEGQGAVLWDTRTGAIFNGKFPIADTSVVGDLAAFTDLEYHFHLLRLPGGTPVARWHDADTCVKNAQAVALSPDGHTLACGTSSGISLVDVRTGRSLPDQPSVGWDPNGGQIWFSPDGRFIVEGGENDFNLIRVADAQTLMTYRGAPEAVGFDGTTLRYLSGGTVVGVDISDLVNPARLPGPAPDEALFSPDGRLLVTNRYGSRSLVLWDVAAHRALGSSLRMLSGDNSELELAFSGDGRFLATVDGKAGNVVRVWDTVKHAQAARLTLQGDWYPHSLAMNTDGTLLAVGASLPVDGDGATRDRLLVWDVRHGRWSTSIDFDGDVEVIFRPHSTMVASLTGSSERLLDLSTGRETDPALGPGSIGNSLKPLAFSPDGNTAAVDDGSGRLAFRDVRTGRRHGPSFPLNSGNSASQVVFSPKDDVAASIGSMGNVQLWDLGTPRKLGQPIPSGDPALMSAAFAPDGSVLHTVDAAGVLRDIPVDPARIAATLCARAGRTLTNAEWQHYLAGVPYRSPCP